MIEIQQAELLTNLFGHWPDFHDAELSVLRLDASGHEGPALEAEFEVAEMSQEIDERGYYRDRHRARTTLRFERVARLRLSDFLYQNAIAEMTLREAGPNDYDEFFRDDPLGRRRYRVQWTSSIGCEADFLCDEIRVLRAASAARAI